jgi:signal transduction histidine kinase
MTSTPRAVAVRAGLDVLYLTIGLATSIVAMTVAIVGVTVSLSLAVFIVGLPVILLSALAFRWTAELDRKNAVLVLGEPLRGRYRDHRGERLLARLAGTVRDPQTWRDLAWLVLHAGIGLAFGIAAIALVAHTVGLALLPLWFWAIPDGTDWAIPTWEVDHLWEAVLAAPLAVPLAAITVAALRLMAIGESQLASLLLGAPGDAPVAPERPVQRRDRARASGPEPGAVLALHASLSGFLAVLMAVLWGLTSRGYFWPMWVWFGLGVPLALHAAVRSAWRSQTGRRRGLAVHGAIAGVLGSMMIVIWVLSGTGYFWPIWPLLGFAVVLAAHGVLLSLWDRLSPQREQELVERVDVLTRTRRGALDVQAAELRRIERDLHDGAQARLVALSMQLGRAEERLSDQPEVAELFRKARGEASAAIAELRDLARGIAPPVLADRGLVAAVEALGRRSAVPVDVDVKLDRRPVPVIETAAYFVVAETLTNVAKHAPRARAAVMIAVEGDWLVVEVADNGPGGADPGGGGLTGLRHRVQALDGTLAIVSPPGHGTTIRAELPFTS